MQGRAGEDGTPRWPRTGSQGRAEQRLPAGSSSPDAGCDWLFLSKGLGPRFAVSKAVMNEPLLGLRGHGACVCIQSYSHTNTRESLLVDTLL